MRNPYPHLADWKRLAFYLCVCFFICLCGCSACNTSDENDQIRSLTYLQEEFKKIPPVPNSSTKRPTRTSEKGSQGLVANDYISSATADEIKAHYHKELLERGWSFCRTEKVIYRNVDYGGQHVFYRKGMYIADLQLAGKQESEFGWTYAFSMSWRLFDDVHCS